MHDMYIIYSVTSLQLTCLQLEVQAWSRSSQACTHTNSPGKNIISPMHIHDICIGLTQQAKYVYILSWEDKIIKI